MSWYPPVNSLLFISNGGTTLRLRRKSWIPAALDKFSDWLVRFEAGATYKGRWAEAFGRTAPLHVEVGTGKGRFVSQMALRDSHVNYLGIERELEVIYYALEKAQEAEIANLRLMEADVARLEELFAPGEIDRLFINFCDPWPKKRHAKRRLTHVDFLALYRRVVKKGGEIHFKTDNRELFDFSLEQFAEAGLPMKDVTFDLVADARADNIMTEYEEKFSGQGTPICRCVVVLE